MLKLIIEDDEGRKTVVPFVRDEITIGRQEGNTIRLTERNVSRRHARLVRQNGHVLVEDLGSYNGIRINGDKIQGQVPVREGDLIQIGDYDLAVQADQTQAQATAATSPMMPVNAAQAGAALDPVEKPAQRASAATSATMKLPDLGATIPALPPVGDLSATLGDDEGPEEANPDDVQMASGESDSGRRHSTAIIRMDQVESNRLRQVIDIDPSEAPRLVVLNTEFAGREFACIRTELKIGRILDNDIAIDHRSLSRTHCKIVREDTGEWRVVDLQSANGLMVNGEPYAQSALRTGDTLELGHVKFKFVGPGQSFTLSPTAEGVQVKHRSNSKAPMLSIVALMLVAVASSAYWFVLRQMPVEEPKVEKLAGVPPTDLERNALTPEEQNKVTEEKLAEARVEIEALDWKKAERILKTCFVAQSPCPAATALLAQMNQEKGHKVALENAEAALEANNLEKAQSELSMAAGSHLLANRHKLLEERLRKDIADNISAVAAKQPIEKVKPPEARAVEVPKPAVDPSTVLFEEGKRLFKDKQYPAAKTQLEKCIKVMPKHADCHKLLGTTWAKLGDPDKGAREYKEFLRLAPPDHPDFSRVTVILDSFEKQK